MSLSLPTFNTITSMIADTLSHNALSHCQLLTKSIFCPSTVITTDGGCVTAFEVIGMSRYLTEATEEDYLDDITESLSNVLREPNHKIGFYHTRDPNRTNTQLEDIFRTTHDTIKRLGFEASHFFEAQAKDLAKHCAYERSIITVYTSPRITKKDTVVYPTIANEKIKIDYIPETAQNTFSESQSIVDAHKAYCRQFKSRLASFMTIEEYTADHYMQALKEEEDLISLNQTGWRVKGAGDPIDISLWDSEVDLVTYPPLAHQLITNNKDVCKGDRSIFENNSTFIATIDREFFPISPEPYSKLLTTIPKYVPIRTAFEFETGTEQIVDRLNARKSWVIFFLFSKASRDVHNALNELTTYAEKNNGCLLGGSLSVATWADSLEKAKEYKKEISQALTSWGTTTVRTPNCCYESYTSTLPALARNPSARRCVQPLKKHIITSPVTRPASPMTSGAICMSSMDGRLIPIDPASPAQNYSINVITGAMGGGKTVFSSIFNDAFIFGAGNSELPLLGYTDFGTGVHNYLASVRNELPRDQQYKIELIKFTNTNGHRYNILEPQFGLHCLEEQELAFASAFICRIVNGRSKSPVHPKIADTIVEILIEMFAHYKDNPIEYTSNIGEYHGMEMRMHTEIREMLDDRTVIFEKNERLTWYNLRDKLYMLGSQYFDHARFAHRQGSPSLTEFMKFIQSSSSTQNRFQAFKANAQSDTPLLSYITLSIETILNRFKYIFDGPSQIDISQARIIGCDLKGIVRGNDEESLNLKRMFGMLAKYVVEKNFWREPESFMPLVPDIYKDMYRGIIALDSSMKKHSFCDEYKQVKSPELDSIMDNSAVIARKYGMCISVASQSPSHLPPELLKLATNLYIIDMTASDAEYLAETYSLSNSFISEAQQLVGKTEGFGRNILYIGQFKKVKGYVVQILRNYITPAYLWKFASDSEDDLLRNLARQRFGAREAYLKLGKRFPDGTCQKEIELRLKTSKFDSVKLTKEEVILEFVRQLDGIDTLAA